MRCMLAISRISINNLYISLIFILDIMIPNDVHDKFTVCSHLLLVHTCIYIEETHIAIHMRTEGRNCAQISQILILRIIVRFIRLISHLSLIISHWASLGSGLILKMRWSSRAR